MAKQPTATTNIIPFEKAVIGEGKDIVAKLKELDGEQTQLQLRLGELADKATTEAKEDKKNYGNRTLAKFAEAIGIVERTLSRYRDTYRAGRTFPPRGGNWRRTRSCGRSRVTKTASKSSRTTRT